MTKPPPPPRPVKPLFIFPKLRALCVGAPLGLFTSPLVLAQKRRRLRGENLIAIQRDKKIFHRSRELCRVLLATWWWWFNAVCARAGDE